MDKLLIFGDANLIFPQILIKEIYSIHKEFKDFIICGVVDTTSKNPSPKLIRAIKNVSSNLAKKIFNPEQKLYFNSYMFNNLHDICSKLNIKIYTPPSRDINNNKFINFIKESVKPTMGLAVGCLQIFKKDLIDIFDILVNYHNGFLPDYGGRKATSWSVYYNEDFTGFTYHYINEGIDKGNIVLQGVIPILDTENNIDLDYLKTLKASQYIRDLLCKMIARDKGIAQVNSEYFGIEEYKAITSIENPSKLTFFEIKRRLLAFKKLKIKINDKYYPVTKIKIYHSNLRMNPKMTFNTIDNILVKPVRFSYLPFFSYKIKTFVKKC